MTSIKNKLRQFVAAIFAAFNKSRFRRIPAAIFAAFTIFLLSAPATAQTFDNVWHVDEDAPGGDGENWPTAFNNLQDALDAAADTPDPETDLIKVAQGVYVPTVETFPGNPRSVTFELSGSNFNNITIQGGYAGINEADPDVRDVDLYVTTLSGELGNPGMADNAYHVLKFVQIDSSVSIDGVTIRDALADGTNAFDRSGAGFLSNLAEPVIRNCVIRDNEAQEFGGGAWAIRKGPIFVRCTFRNNTAGDGGGALFQRGAPNGLPAVHLVLVNCEFWDNDGGDAGGGLAIGDFINAPGTTYEITNCLFVRNDATFGGAAFFSSLTGGGGIITNCTFIGNTTGSAIWGAGALAPMTITNSILWFNTPDQVVDSEAEINYTNIEGGWTGTGTGNIGDLPGHEPIFGPGVDNYRMEGDSRGVDEGNNADVPCDEFDVDEDGFNCISNPPQDTPDLDLRDRVVDGDENMTATVDMGAYEFAQCPWDINGDCVVGAGDLLSLLVQWGACADCNNCPADFDGNCTVGATDLLALLVNWGPCSCGDQSEALTLEEELADACLTQEDWDEFEDVMTDPNSSQEDKDRYECWMTHYLFHCNKCNCSHPSECPSPDPFDD